MIKLYDGQIADLLPNNISENSEVRALSYSISVNMRKWFDKIKCGMVVIEIDSLSETILDARAAELNVPYYEPDMPLSKKRQLVKNIIKIYQKAGTKQAVKEMLDMIFDSAELQEWFNYNGEPGTFQVLASSVPSAETLELFNKTLEKVKNASSTLMSISTGIELKSSINIATGFITASCLEIKED